MTKIPLFQLFTRAAMRLLNAEHVSDLSERRAEQRSAFPPSIGVGVASDGSLAGVSGFVNSARSRLDTFRWQPV